MSSWTHVLCVAEVSMPASKSKQTLKEQVEEITACYSEYVSGDEGGVDVYVNPSPHYDI